ncbi:MAG: hypothetical protein AAGF89_01605 [Bacteroidota bacterium]
MRTFFLLCAFVCLNFSAQAQVDDTLPPWFKADVLQLELEKIVGPLSFGQTSELDEALASLREQAVVVKPSQRGQLRKQMRQSLTAILTPEQRKKLKANPDGLKALLASTRKRGKG